MIKNSSAGKLVWSSLSAQCSEQIALAAAPIVVVVVLGGGATETGVVQLVQTLPFLLFSLPLGVLIDRCSRKGMMVLSEALRAATAFAIFMALLYDVLSIPLLTVFGFVGAIGTLGFSIAGPALLPTLVERHQLSSMNRWLELARSTAFVGGPPIAGALVAWTGGPLAFATAATASLMAMALLLPIHEPPQRQLKKRSVTADLAEGFCFVMNHKLLRPIAATAMLFNVGWFMLQTVLVVFMINGLGLSSSSVGLLFGCYGVGMVAGAIASSSLSSSFSLGLLIVIGPLGGFIGSLLVLTSWVTMSSGLLAFALFCFGFGPILWSINTTSLRQVVTPPDMHGRVTALLTLATSGARPVGSGIGIIVVSNFGMGACLLCSALCFGAQLLVIQMSSASRLRGFPQSVDGAVD